MASFQGKIGWKRLRKREIGRASCRERQRKSENKNYRSITFLPNRLEIIPEK